MREKRATGRLLTGSKFSQFNQVDVTDTRPPVGTRFASSQVKRAGKILNGDTRFRSSQYPPFH